MWPTSPALVTPDLGDKTSENFSTAEGVQSCDWISYLSQVSKMSCRCSLLQMFSCGPVSHQMTSLAWLSVAKNNFSAALNFRFKDLLVSDEVMLRLQGFVSLLL